MSADKYISWLAVIERIEQLSAHEQQLVEIELRGPDKLRPADQLRSEILTDAIIGFKRRLLSELDLIDRKITQLERRLQRAIEAQLERRLQRAIEAQVSDHERG